MGQQFGGGDAEQLHLGAQGGEGRGEKLAAAHTPHLFEGVVGSVITMTDDESSCGKLCETI